MSNKHILDKIYSSRGHPRRLVMAVSENIEHEEEVRQPIQHNNKIEVLMDVEPIDIVEKRKTINLVVPSMNSDGYIAWFPDQCPNGNDGH